LAAVAFALIAAGCSAQRGIPFAGIVAFGLTGAVLSAVLGAVAQPAAGYPWALAGAALAGAALGVAGGWASHDALLAMVVAFGAAGGLVGAVGRLVLRRLGIACRAPWCELAGGVLSAVVGWRAAAGLLGWSWLAVPLLLGWLAVPLAVADINCRRLPNVLTLTAGPVLGLAVVIGEPSAALRAAAGVAVFGGAHAVVRAVAPAAMGGGDVKLAAGLGVVLGALGWADVALAATLAATGTLLLAVVTRSRTAPHGPGLLGATWLLAAVSHLG
jgi:leader peptidase (prepilin peptidase)/N-methyltransferase